MSRAASAQNAVRIAPPALVFVVVAAGAGIHGSLPVQQDDAPHFVVSLHDQHCHSASTPLQAAHGTDVDRGSRRIRQIRSTMPDRNCVVIVGAGPVGLVSAVRLAQSGIPSILLEASATTPRDLRASTVHPPTLDMLDEIGVADDYIKLGIITDSWQVIHLGTRERVLFDLSVDQGPHAASLPPAMRAVQPLADPVRARAGVRPGRYPSRRRGDRGQPGRRQGRRRARP